MGTGIAPEHLPYLFEPYFTTRSKQGGTGLGLAVVKTLVTEMGGSVVAETKFGRGSQFIVYLPWKNPIMTLENVRLVVIDDDPGIVDYLLDMLRHKGYSAVGFTQTDEALSAIEKEPFDLVISDVVMPGMRGLELMTAIHRKRPEQLVLLITAFGSIDLAMQSRGVAIFAKACFGPPSPSKQQKSRERSCLRRPSRPAAFALTQQGVKASVHHDSTRCRKALHFPYAKNASGKRPALVS